MSRSEQRRMALRLCLTIPACAACLLAWVCVLTFNVADPPADNVWPQADPARNWCGVRGAWVAYHLFYYLGVGAYPLLALVTLAVFAWAKGARLNDLWLRLIGLTLVCASFGGLGALFITASDRYLMTGPGGVLGTAAAFFLQTNLQKVGASILLASACLVGFLLAADELVVRFVRWLGWARQKSGPVLVRGGQALAGVGASLAGGVANVAGRLATANVNGNGSADHTNNGNGTPPPVTPRPKPADLKKAEEKIVAQSRLDEKAVTPAGSAAPALGATPSARTPETVAARPAPVPASVAPAVTPAAAASPAPVPIREIPKPHFKEPEKAAEKEKEKEKPTRKEAPPAFTLSSKDDDYKLPGLDLLEEGTVLDKQAIEVLCREKAYTLEQTLNEFRLEAQVVGFETGPVITVFELKLSPGIKVSQITSLSNDMARALRAPSVRVVAPLPGKNTIGIEVPNIDKERVRLKDTLLMAGPRTERYAIPLCLGKDAAGQPLVSDLTQMPHLLIAGTTGSGKSVCISSIIMSVLLTRSPNDVQLIMVDPKVVELAMYKDVPHLMCPIITEMSKAESILDWAATKMDERYALLAEAGVKDIRSYNNLGIEQLKERFQPTTDEEMAKIPTHLPYIVILIDELADLMMTSAKEVEFYLCRLAQKSRAVGIHLIVATQRPQANVVTGLIKSNLPCRIAFRVSSRLDSRIVLDQNGGEVLMGQGDMLFLPPGSAKLVRAQGTFISDDELKRIVKHCREQRAQQFNPELIRMPSAAGDGATERDELFDQAVDIILETGRGSVSLLQRRLTIGYSRASRLIDQMYGAGIVGEYKGSQAREVIMSKEDWQAVRSQRDREEADEAAETK